MEKVEVLVIEDDPDILELIEYNLEREGFAVHTAEDGEEGLEAAHQRPPSLILLDLMLPGVPGLEVCRALRRDHRTLAIPIIIVTARGEEADVVLGLELGADDYIAKPFSIRELIARIRAVLRRKAPGAAGANGRIHHGPMTIDVERYEVTLDGEPVMLTLAEFRLVRALASRPGRVFTREQLIGEITAGGYRIAERNVDVHVAAVRRKLKEHAGLIATVRGVGYKFKD